MKKIGELLISDNLTEEEIVSIREKLLKFLSDKYIFLFYHNLEKNYTSVKMVTDNMLQRTIDALESSEDYLATFCEATGRLVHPDDREKVLKIFNPDYYTKELRKKKRISVVFRCKYYEEYYRWNRIEVVKLEAPDEEPKNVIIGCENVDDEQKKKQERGERDKQYQSGIYALSQEYSSVYYVKLDTNEVYPYNLSSRIEGMFGDQFYKLDYSNAVSVYVDKAVIEGEKNKMLHILSADYIIRKLKDGGSFTKVYLNNNNEYCEMKCVKVDQEDGSNVVVMGFAEKDREIRQEQQQREEFTMQYAMLEGLSHEYNSVWLAKPNRELELFRAYKAETKDMLQSIRRDGLNIEPVIKHYINDFVVPEDREKILELFNYEALMQTIPEQGVVKHTYRRRVDEGEYRYMQVIIAKARNPHGWANLIIAFRDVDDIVRYRIEQEAALDKAIRARDTDILTKLKNRYYYERQLEVYAEMDFESITCIYIDVNGLHEVNNEKGHEAGDDMLRRVALYISKIWGDENSYRIGGDEFVVFVFDKEKDEITGDVDGFGKALNTYGYSASVGYARETGKVDDIQDLIRDAETEMYKAKKNHYKGARDRRRRQ